MMSFASGYMERENQEADGRQQMSDGRRQAAGDSSPALQ